MTSVRLVQLDATTLDALAAGDLAAAQRSSPVPLTPYVAGPDWRGTWRRRSRQIAADPACAAWITRLVWAPAVGLVVGRAGFHGPPDEAGMVEVGYATDPAQRRRGYARAALESLLEQARAEPTVRAVRASVGPGNTASAALVTSCGFVAVGEQIDDEDGPEIVYERPARP